MIPIAVRTAPARVSAITAEARAGRPIRLLILLALTLGVLAGCGTAATPAAAPARGGGYPTFLPKNTLNYHSDTAATGTAQRPALTNQGDGVQVKTPQWSVLVTVTGPEVPGEGLPLPGAPRRPARGWSPCRRRPARCPSQRGISPASTWTTTSTGRPSCRASRKPPTVLRPGQKASFELRAVEASRRGPDALGPERPATSSPNGTSSSRTTERPGQRLGSGQGVHVGLRTAAHIGRTRVDQVDP